MSEFANYTPGEYAKEHIRITPTTLAVSETGPTSDNFSVSLKAEVARLEDVPGEVERVYQILQASVDGQIVNAGFVPGQEQPAPAPKNDASNDSRPWKCSDKQKALIQKIVSDYFDIRMADMTSNRRPAAIAFPRQVAMYLCRTLTRQSLPTLGVAFNRNHATVLHACRLVEDKLKTDHAFRQTMMVLQQRLTKRS